MSEPTVLPGAEPFSAEGGPHGALVCHGFTGSPQSMRGLAEAFAKAGFAVELPRLPGHGTTVEDMATTGWADWSAAIEKAYQDLASRVDKVVVAGLSMGGTLTLWLAQNHPEIVGIVCINAAAEPLTAELQDALRDLIDQGHTTMPGVGSDIADPDSKELAYEATPLEGILSLGGATTEVHGRLGEISCPVLILSAPQDHVVPPVSSDIIAEQCSGPVERVTLERSYHVATLDFDKDLIEEKAVEFALRVTA